MDSLCPPPSLLFGEIMEPQMKHRLNTDKDSHEKAQKAQKGNSEEKVVAGRLTKMTDRRLTGVSGSWQELTWVNPGYRRLTGVTEG
jgi:hypothetical protein